MDVNEVIEALRRRLIDVTRKNLDLNFRPENAVQIVDEIPDQLMSILDEDKTLSLIPLDHVSNKIEPIRELDKSKWKEHCLSKLRIDKNEDLPDSPQEGKIRRHTDHNIQTDLLSDELRNVLNVMYRKENETINNHGCGTLYIAFGLLKFKVSEDSEIYYTCPILKHPINLVKIADGKKNLATTYVLKSIEEETQINLGLDIVLRTNHEIVLPEYKCDGKHPISKYLNELTEALKSLRHIEQFDFQIQKHAFLVSATSISALIYADLDPEKWRDQGIPVEKNELLQKLLRHGDVLPDLPIQEIETVYEKLPYELQPKLIMDADLTQKEAIRKALNGRNIVLQGPPGTGKSQTIANLIAAALYQGKKVLFVAEKSSAINVVKKRIDECGLGSYLLDLHGVSSNRSEVIKSLKQACHYSLNDGTEGQKRVNSNFPGIDDAEEYSRVLNTVDEMLDKKYFEILLHAGAFKKYYSPEILKNEVFAKHLKGLSKTIFESTKTDILHLKKREATIKSKTGLALNYVDWASINAKCISDGAHPFLDGMDKFQELYKFNCKDLSYDITLAEVKNLIVIGLKARSLGIHDDVLIECLQHDVKILSDACQSLGAISEEKEAQHDILLGYGISYMPNYEVPLNTINLLNYFESTKEFENILSDIQLSTKEIASLQNGMQAIYIALNTQQNTNFVRQADTILNMAISWFAASCGGIDLRFFGLKNLKNDAWTERLGNILKTLSENTGLKFDKVYANKNDLLTDIEKLLERRRFFALSVLRNPKAYIRVAKATSKIFPTVNDVTNLQNYLKSINTVKQSLTDEESLQLEKLVSNRLDAKANTSVALVVVKKILTVIEDAVGVINYRHLSRMSILKMSSDLPDIQKVLEFASFLLQNKKPFLSMLVSATENEFLERIANMIVLADAMKDSYLSGLVCHQTLELGKCAHVHSAYYKYVQQTKKLHETIEAFNKTFVSVSQDEIKKIVNLIKYVNTSKLGWPSLQKSTLQNICKQGDIFQDLLRIHHAYFSHVEGRNTLKDIHEHMNHLLTYREDIEEVFTCLNLRKEFIEKFGDCFFEALVSLKTSDAVISYESMVYNYIGNRILRGNQILNTYDGDSLVGMVEKYKKYDSSEAGRNRMLIASNLEVKRREAIHARTECAMKLRNEFERQRRHMPIRQLLDSCLEHIWKIKPCFLMSPESVTKLLPRNIKQFDLLVIDEASQVKLEMAMGCILRSRQCVIVGDKHQLPPTTYFEAQDSESDRHVIVDGHQSVLTWASANLQEILMLKWHYRSQHDSLIRMSNHLFYGDKLVVFPSNKINHPNYGFKFIPCAGGVYEGGGANPMEAQFVVERVVNFIKSYRRNEIPSVAIITMNARQKEIVLQLIENNKKHDPDFAERVGSLEEELIVQNLENIQGDERDVVFISLTYGPDETGHVFQRFGPIASEFGENRLNVIFTRSRQMTELISSMSPDDVRVDGAPKGTQVLRKFMEYAQTHKITMTDYQETSGETESPFEDDILEYLISEGYTCRCQVGVKGYRIDIGVIDPENSTSFLLGIECDGATYHSSKSMRDRDITKQNLLEKLGWNIFRIWSTDWFKNPVKVKRNLLAYIHSLQPLSPQPVHEDVVIQLQ